MSVIGHKSCCHAQSPFSKPGVSGASNDASFQLSGVTDSTMEKSRPVWNVGGQRLAASDFVRCWSAFPSRGCRLILNRSQGRTAASEQNHQSREAHGKTSSHRESIGTPKVGFPPLGNSPQSTHSGHPRPNVGFNHVRKLLDGCCRIFCLVRPGTPLCWSPRTYRVR